MRRHAALLALLLTVNAFALPRPSLPDDRHSVSELRLGIVCYGGISLAIYMHGNTRELHHLARASAALECDAEGIGCGGVAQGSAFDTLPESAQQYYTELVRKWRDEKVRTRVVIDVISGTSAGGINGIFLAKALASNRPIDGLRSIWFDEASVSRLATGYPWPLFAIGRLLTGRSALGGASWLRKLYDTMNVMDKNQASPQPSLLAYGQDLDLLVTATDFYGTERTLEIGSPPTSSELRHDHVFSFKASRSEDGRQVSADDFGPSNNATLAFAARSSASFPVAFPPITVSEAATVMKREDLKTKIAAAVFADRIADSKKTEPETLADHLFLVDGGVLDNYPFDIAFRRVGSRTPKMQTRRVFIYLEPDPRTPRPPDAEKTLKAPNVKQMFWNAQATIPGSEPIARDLLEIANHNQRVDRIREIIRRDEREARLEYANGKAEKNRTSIAHRVEQTLGFGMDSLSKPGELQTRMFRLSAADIQAKREAIENDARQSLPLVEEAYMRLRVHSVLDQFSRVLASKLCTLPQDYDSLRTSLVRELVFQWAELRCLTGDEVDTARREQFLQTFDLGYVRRRLRFVNDWLNAQYGAWNGQRPNRDDLQVAQSSVATAIDELSDLLRLNRLAGLDIKNEFDHAGAVFCVEPVGQPRQQAQRLLADPDKAKVLDDLEAKAGQRLRDEQQRILAGLYDQFVEQTGDWNNPDAARAVLARYLGFAYWDRVAYPYTAFSGVGDLTRIEITRFSPNDSKTINGKGAGKLTGTGLGHFGAFFDRDGREKDYLWGRLDGAEHVLNLLGRNDQHRLLEIAGTILTEEKAVVHAKNLVEIQHCVDSPGSCAN